MFASGDVLASAPFSLVKQQVLTHLDSDPHPQVRLIAAYSILVGSYTYTLSAHRKGTQVRREGFKVPRRPESMPLQAPMQGNKEAFASHSEGTSSITIIMTRDAWHAGAIQAGVTASAGTNAWQWGGGSARGLLAQPKTLQCGHHTRSGAAGGRRAPRRPHGGIHPVMVLS